MVVILHVNIIVWYIDIIVYYYYIDITKLVSLTLQYIDIYWLVVWNMHFIFHNIWGNPSHWLSYFSIWLKPQARYIYVLFIYIPLYTPSIYIYTGKECAQKNRDLSIDPSTSFFFRSSLRRGSHRSWRTSHVPRRAESRESQWFLCRSSMFLMGYNDQK
jgi:hypothetical protein